MYSIIFFLLIINQVRAANLETNLGNLNLTLQSTSQQLKQTKPQKPLTPFEEKIEGPTYFKYTREEFDPFENVMGISEKQFQALSVQAQQQFFNANNNTIIKQTKAPQLPQQFAAGTFEVLSLKELRHKTNNITGTKNSTFSVLEGYDKPWENWFRPLVDVTALQADPQNVQAVFQIASNFNTLEGLGNPKQGIMAYLSPGLYVQGEAAAISAMPGIINRMYFIPHKVNGKMYKGQLAQQINLLDAFYPNIEVANGYLTSIKKNVFSNLTEQQKRNYIDQVKMAFHENIQVTGGLGPLRDELPTYNAVNNIDNKNQLINQIFSAAMQNPNINSNADTNLAQILLNASYEGVLYYSFYKKKNKVFLTLIGGGVFNNPLGWIIDAIEKSVSQFKNKGGLDIIVVVYYSGGYDKQSWELAKNRLLKLTHEMSGTYHIFKKDGIYNLTLK